ncbi:hypothetical protein WM29_22815 [Burkholderia ubonensis]|uniref:hypothetical protein n=1 Tax=Burkholderia ubonensis TaxID=101571 RepID=UPI0008415E8A|nr:hypothetical protein [Burkholderia ubonensis]AOK61966.1 hypothetical protein WM29_22815 [Burkholderia ubonensis]
MSDFYVIAVYHTIRDHLYITLWRPDDCGYTPVLPRAGKYTQQQIESHLGYYNTGDHIAVPVNAVDQLATSIPAGFFDYAGDGVPNTKASWDAIRAAVTYPTEWPIKPEWYGKRRRRTR